VLAAVLEIPGEAPVVREYPDPDERPGHTLVTMTAAPIVPLDQLVASGTSYFGRPATPCVPGT
jgi:NADPH:quinone reductase-like Zn-dependent oxidoreductase